MIAPDSTTDALQPAPAELLSGSISSTYIVATGIGFGVLGAVLTYGHSLALGFACYVIALMAGLFATARFQKVKPASHTIFLILLIVFFTIMLVIRADPFLQAVNMGAGIFAALLLVYFFTSRNFLEQDLMQYGYKSMIAGGSIWIQPIEELIQTRRWVATHHFHGDLFKPILRGLLITVPVVTMFVILLSSADSVFNDFVSRIFRNLLKKENIHQIAHPR
jgi:hypothetical protein